jgi:radical SAM protein with 4Fe4S-binding SPASM domain
MKGLQVMSQQKKSKEELRNLYLSEDFPKVVAISMLEGPCTHRCRMCPVPERGHELPHSQMDFPVFERIVERLRNQDVQFEISAYGETLLHPDVESFVAYAKKELPALSITLVTNGILLDKRRMEKIVASGLDILQVSLDAGSPESYLWLTGKDCYPQIEENLRVALQVRKSLGSTTPLVRTHMIQMKEMEHEFDSFLGRWKGIVEEVNIRPLGNWGGLIRNKGCTPMWDVKSERYPCPWPWYASKILSNGDVMGCFSQIFGETPALGNIRQDSLLDIWHGRAMSSFRGMLMNNREEEMNSICRNCTGWSLFPDPWYIKEEIQGQRVYR